MPKFRYKSLGVEAVQWTGDNFEAIKKLVEITGSTVGIWHTYANGYALRVETIDGVFKAFVDCWIVKDFNDSLHIYSPQMFEMVFEPENEEGS